ncbi:MAG: AAA family ATPase [Betaproteobacteria bacterium]|nr:AAA family ATPase [Betaproteobacteria bacterium]MDE2623119.1 AAA family ATPase [Betaproteobacteria bacterium]
MIAHASSHGRVFALLSCKGGVGTTQLTVQLGRLLAQRWQLNVLIVDWVHPFGDAALLLSTEDPHTHLGDLLRQPERLDAALLDSALLRPQPRLAVLAAAEKANLQPLLQHQAVQRLITLARERFDCILCDCGRQFDPLLMALLQDADRVMPVFQPTLAMIRDARRLLVALLEAGIGPDRVLPVLNRMETRHQPLLDLLEQVLGTRLQHRLPEHPDFAVPLHQTRDHSWQHGMVRLAATLARKPEPQDDPSGILQRWWRKQWRWNPQPPEKLP